MHSIGATSIISYGVKTYIVVKVLHTFYDIGKLCERVLLCVSTSAVKE